MKSFAIMMTIAEMSMIFATLGCRAKDIASHRLPFLNNPSRDELSKTEAPSEHAQCQTTDDQWARWKTSEISRAAKSDYASNTRYIYDHLQECEPQIKKLSSSQVSFSNLRRFTHRHWLSKQPSHKLGLNIEDQAYLELLESRGYLSLPKSLSSQEFLLSLNNTTGDDAALIEKQIRTFDASWRAVYFRSRNLPTVDNSQARSRLLVYVPGATHDRFIQFGVRDDITAPLSSIVSQIIIEKTNFEDGSPLSKPIAHLIDLWRIRSAIGIQIVPRVSTVKTSEPCYSCHQSPLIKINPQPDTVKDDLSKIDLYAINDQIKKYGAAEFAGLDRNDLGPVVGDVVSEEQLLRAQECVRSFTADDELVNLVVSSMHCSSCHNGHRQFELQYYAAMPNQFALDTNMLRQSIVIDKTMPPDPALSDSGRKILFECLVRQTSRPDILKGDLEQWLLESDLRN
ncbi:MAG: hypothetical protein FJ146_18610 [Deltaproteobacteria bacterium]|nr:hypothetical protein [Deltaproteobacteria bacterium]